MQKYLLLIPSTPANSKGNKNKSVQLKRTDENSQDRTSRSCEPRSSNGAESGVISRSDQTSLFDFDSPETIGAEDTDTFFWKGSRRGRSFIKKVADFTADFGETPIIRIISTFNQTATYLTDPNNALVVNTTTGMLIDDHRTRRNLFRNNLESLPFLRRSFISSQVVAVLDGELEKSDWIPEISLDHKFDHDMKDDLIALLDARSIKHSFDERGIYGEVRLFGDPEAIASIVSEASSNGMLILLKK